MSQRRGGAGLAFNRWLPLMFLHVVILMPWLSQKVLEDLTLNTTAFVWKKCKLLTLNHHLPVRSAGRFCFCKRGNKRAGHRLVLSPDSFSQRKGGQSWGLHSLRSLEVLELPQQSSTYLSHRVRDLQIMDQSPLCGGVAAKCREAVDLKFRRNIQVR